MELELKPTSLQPILGRCNEAVSALADRKSIVIKIPNTAATVMADERRLSQIIINLLGNAIKFSPEKSVIEIRVEAAAKMVHISITDHGPGFPQSKRI